VVVLASVKQQFISSLAAAVSLVQAVNKEQMVDIINLCCYFILYSCLIELFILFKVLKILKILKILLIGQNRATNHHHKWPVTAYGALRATLYPK